LHVLAGRAAQNAGLDEGQQAIEIWQGLAQQYPKDGQEYREIQSGLLLLLRAQADRAARQGEYGLEAELWRRVQELLPEDAQAIRRLPIAQENLEVKEETDFYETARRNLAANKTEESKIALQYVWQLAPHYGDPAGLADQLGLAVPGWPTDVDKKAQEEAERRERWESELDRSRERQERANSLSYELQQKRDRRRFMDNELSLHPAFVYLGCFLFLIGPGLLISIFTQSWLWPVGITVALAGLAYAAGYRRAIWPIVFIPMAIASVALVYSFSLYPALLNYNLQHTSTLWVVGNRLVWLGREAKFGLLCGALFGLCSLVACSPGWIKDWIYEQVHWAYKIKAYHPTLGLSVLLASVIFLWLLIFTLASVFGWGFGWGYGFYWGLIGIVVDMLVGGGIGCLWAVVVASANVSKDIKSLREQLSRVK
jgi:hypothetical protein